MGLLCSRSRPNLWISPVPDMSSKLLLHFARWLETLKTRKEEVVVFTKKSPSAQLGACVAVPYVLALCMPKNPSLIISIMKTRNKLSRELPAPQNSPP